MITTRNPLAWVPAHPSLAVLAWEDTRTDVHGVACATRSGGVSYLCACGFETEMHPTELDASAELISHAVKTCAECGADKPLTVRPTCAQCAYPTLLAAALDTPIMRICRAADDRRAYVIAHPTEFTADQVAMARNTDHDHVMLNLASVLRYGD